jgi:hypothetical protein
MPPAWNHEFAARLDGLDFVQSFARGMDGERIFAGENVFRAVYAGSLSLHELMPDPGSNAPYDLIGWIKEQRYRATGMIRIEEADYIDMMARARILVGQSAPSQRMMEQELDAVFAGFTSDRLILSLIAPVYHKSLAMMWDERARINVTEVGLALERYRQAKGEYPATLAALVPEFLRAEPADPFTEKPLIYRTESDGAVVYSVGRNLRDDRGVGDNATGKDDLSWFDGTAAARKFAPPPAPPSLATP